MTEDYLGNNVVHWKWDSKKQGRFRGAYFVKRHGKTVLMRAPDLKGPWDEAHKDLDPVFDAKKAEEAKKEAELGEKSFLGTVRSAFLDRTMGNTRDDPHPVRDVAGRNWVASRLWTLDGSGKYVDERLVDSNATLTKGDQYRFGRVSAVNTRTGVHYDSSGRVITGREAAKLEAKAAKYLEKNKAPEEQPDNNWPGKRQAAKGGRTAPTVYGYVNDKGRKFDFDDLRRNKESADDMANATKGVKQFAKALNSTAGMRPDVRRRLVGARGAGFVDAVTSAFREEALRASPTGGVVRVVDPSTGDRFSFPYSRLVTDKDDRRLRVMEILKYGGQRHDANANPGDLLVPDERAVRGIHVRQMDAKGGRSAS